MKNVSYQLKNVQGHTQFQKIPLKGSWAHNDLEDKLQKPAHNAEKGQMKILSETRKESGELP